MNKSEKFWNKISDNYDDQLKRYERTYLKTIENTKKYLDKDDIVLDYACGTGIILVDIADSVKEIHAVDIASKMIEIARRKADERNLKNIHFAQTELFDDRFKEKSFDVVFAFNILYLLSDVTNVLKRINALLKPGGMFISATDCLGEKKMFVNTLKYMLSKIGILPFMHMLTTHELETLIMDAHFKIIETEKLSDASSNYFIASKKIDRA
jgi:ubiquinone/menaquinone biosynthesis C-methylase UbiE